MASAEGKKEEAETRAGPSAWLDADFIEEALRVAGQPAKVVGLTARHANAVGDHYGSEMFRVIARLGSGGEVPLIVKHMVREGNFAEAVKKTSVFPVEGKVMGQIIPALNQLLEEAMPGESPPFAARFLHSGDSPTEFLVLEDLAPAGFRLADRHRGLGLRHSLLVVRALGRFHAASVALHARDPTVFEDLPSPWAGESGEPFGRMCSNCLRHFVEVARTWEDLPAEYVTKIERLKESAYKMMVDSNEPQTDGQLNVLIHGDCWINNMLFRYGADGGVEELRYVDFQASHWTSPANDLAYFMYCSVSEDVHIHHLDLLRREYLHELNRTLRALGLADRQMSWEQLKAAEDTCAGYAIFSAFMVCPIIRSKQVFDIEGALGEGGGNNSQHYANPLFRKWAMRLLPEFDRLGWLDQ